MVSCRALDKIRHGLGIPHIEGRDRGPTWRTCVKPVGDALRTFLVQVREHHGSAALPVPPVSPAHALPPEGRLPASVIRGLRQGATSAVPPMLGQPGTTLTVDLGQFGPRGDPSWTGTVLGLRDRYGPFILAYLETLQ